MNNVNNGNFPILQGLIALGVIVDIALFVSSNSGLILGFLNSLIWK